MSDTNPTLLGNVTSTRFDPIRGELKLHFNINVNPEVLMNQPDKGQEFKLYFGNGIGNLDASDGDLLKGDGLGALDGDVTVEMTNSHGIPLDIRTSLTDRNKNKPLTFHNVQPGKVAKVSQTLGPLGKELLARYNRKGLTDFDERINPMPGTNEVHLSLTGPSLLAHMYNKEESIKASQSFLDPAQKDSRGRVYANAQAAANAKINADKLQAKELGLAPIGNPKNFTLTVSVPRISQRGHNNRHHYTSENLATAIQAKNRARMGQLGVSINEKAVNTAPLNISGCVTFTMVRPAD